MSSKKHARSCIALFLVFSFLLFFCCKKTPTTPDVEELTHPIIWLNSFDMSFTASATGGNPASQILEVKNSGQSTLDYTISDDADWLVVEPESGSSTGQINEHTVYINRGVLSSQTEYSATITVSSSQAYNNPQKVNVILKISEKKSPEILVTPDLLTFAYQFGASSSSSKAIYIKNNGTGTLQYELLDDAPWLEVTPKSGTSTGENKTHSVSVNINDLSEGTYQATITVSDSNASNSPQKVDVTLKISQNPPPEIHVTPTSLSFSAKTGGSNPPSQSIWVKNSGDETLNYIISDNAGWLNVSPTSGSSSGEQNKHIISVSAGNLSSGTYNAKISISDSNASNSPQEVMVTLTVSNGQSPEIWISDDTLSFSTTAGGSNPSSQSVQIKNSGTQTLNYTISDDASWLSVDPTSGSSTAEENTHTVSVNTAGLNKGTYTAIITVSDANASNSPQDISVILQLSSATEENKILVSLSPSSGKTGTTVSVFVSIQGNKKEINCFGLELTFDSNLFQFKSVNGTGLTTDWTTVDGNVIRAGVLRIGGFAGSGNSVSAGSVGSIVVIKLEVTESNLSDGTQKQICINNYTDDITGMSPEPSCSTFTYKK